MKNTYNRISTFLTILFNSTLVLLFAIFIISYISPPYPAHSNLKILRLDGHGDHKVLFFEPNIDLRPQFTFNTKQIFLFLTCRSNDKEEMVWSKIVKNGEEYALFSKQINNYSFSCKPDQEYEFELSGNIFPYVGQMLRIDYGTVKIKL